MKMMKLARMLSVVAFVGAVLLSAGAVQAAQHAYGWRPDTPSKADRVYMLPGVPVMLPAAVDLRTNCPTVYDQGQLGSCTANAIAAAWDYENCLQDGVFLYPSRLFIYYNERVIEGSVGSDSGAQLRDGLTAVTKQGVCSEALWPYKIAKFTQKPTAKCYSAALTNQVLQSQRLTQSLLTMKTVLATGHPFVFGFTVYESFESPVVASTGLAPMPKRSEQILGGHAVCAVGYSDTVQCPGAKAPGAFLVRNSWGTTWGLGGYFWIAYEYLTSTGKASDFWAILRVE